MENDIVDENPNEKRRCPFGISSSTMKGSIMEMMLNVGRYAD